MSVLAFVDGSRFALSVCDHAAWAALQLEAPVELVHVLERHRSDPAIATDRSGRLGVDTREALLAQLVELDEERNRLAHEAGRHLLAEAASRVRRNGVTAIQQRLLHGELVDTLHDHEREATLAVLGKRGEGEDHAPAHLGTNLERVIRASHRPVLIAAQEYRPIRRFLLAFDGGPSTGRAIDVLVNAPLLRGAEGQLLMVGTGTEAERHKLADGTSRLRASGVAVTSELRPGEPDEVIPERVASGRIDLLVMGAYGHSRLRTLMIGSTTSALLRTTTASMLVVR